MSDPIKYLPGYSYSGWQASNPTKPLPAQEVDSDLANVAESTDTIVDAIKDVRRSDGALKNSIVTFDSLAPDVLAILGLSDDLDVVAANIDDIIAVAAIDADVTTVAGIAASVTAVASISGSIPTVASIDTEITTVATNIASVNSAASNMAAIIAAPAAASAAAASAAAALTSAGNAATSETNAAANVPIAIHAAAAKTTPVDADELGLADSVASWGLKKLTWANLKAAFINTAQTWTAAQTFLTGTGVSHASVPSFVLSVAGSVRAIFGYTESTSILDVNSDGTITLSPNNVERVRVTTSGRLLVGATTDAGAILQVQAGGNGAVSVSTTLSGAILYDNHYNVASGTATFSQFRYDGVACGSISAASSAATTYATSSDYRIKPKRRDRVGFSARIDALLPAEWDWFIEGGEQGAGFIAHEFAEVYPASVVGEKDAVDEDGTPKYQSMQAATSEVMADIIAELQSLRRRVTQLENN